MTNPQEKVVEILMTAIPEACKILLTFLSTDTTASSLSPGRFCSSKALTHSGLPTSPINSSLGERQSSWALELYNDPGFKIYLLPRPFCDYSPAASLSFLFLK